MRARDAELGQRLQLGDAVVRCSAIDRDRDLIAAIPEAVWARNGWTDHPDCTAMKPAADFEAVP